MNIFRDKTEELPNWHERSVRTAQDDSDTMNRVALPGIGKLDGDRSVENIRRARRGHGY